MFLVRRTEFDVINAGNPLPCFDRTRTVTVFEQYIGDVAYVGVNCDCHFMLRRSHACRHIYSALNIKPTPDHVFPECLKAYETFMMEHREFTNKCCAKKDLLLSKGCLMLEGSLDEVCMCAVDSKMHDLEWFMEAKRKIIDVNKNCDLPGSEDR